MTSVPELVKRLASRGERRTEAEVQADVRSLFLAAPLQLEEGDVRVVSLESQLGDRRRIDVELGSTVVEVKRDLRRGRVREDLVQLAGYVSTRANQTGRRYAGVLTDGVEWSCYNLVQGELQEVSSFSLTDAREDAERLIVWLEGVLATAKGIAPTAQEIRARLGAGSSAHQLDRATLAALYDLNRNVPTVQLKKALWSRLLTSALGTQFEDNDELFVEHTLLVNSAEIIAHAVLGFSLEAINPGSLLTGAKFDESGIYGVVESDFFDWVLEVDGGSSFIRTLSRRLSRFDWDTVDQDVLKVLYESVIGAETRKRLGEYYTPDWLAERIVDEVLTSPLKVRALDPACGSGTFLFHAVRKYVAAAERKGIALAEMLNGVTKSVIGMDLHPVAVTLARVTYLLAIGKTRLTAQSRGVIQIPVYLGDSIQWRQQVDLWTAGNLVIRTDDSRELFSSELRFPDPLLENASLFDQLVSELATKASKRKKGTKAPSLATTLQRLAIPSSFRPIIESTFATMCRLHDEGRDHIWAYYIRNLARPMWLARELNRVDLLIGNPPWLAYRHMTNDMQDTFRSMSDARGLWHGAEMATQPNAAVDRAQYAGFRSGSYEDPGEVLHVAFDVPWDLRRIRPHFFPRGACVVFGKRVAQPKPMGTEVLNWTGQIARQNTTWRDVSSKLTTKPGVASRVSPVTFSPYRDRFSNGATVFPRLLFIVEEQKRSPIGLPSGKIRVQSVRSANEKLPWKNLPGLEGVVETEFIRPVILSECLLPFRITEPAKAVIPLDSTKLLGGGGDEIEMYPGLAEWWAQASASWERHRATERLTLLERLDYMSNLSRQFPSSGIRIVYNKSGMHVVGAKVTNQRAVIENGLYWATAASEEEADYLCAVLNCQTTTELARPFMSYGKDERDIAKHVWQLPIPEFDAANKAHMFLARLGREVQTSMDGLAVDPALHFSATRRRFRESLEQAAPMRKISEIVFEMLS